MVSKLVVEKPAKMPYFSTFSFTKHSYNTKQTSVVYYLLSKTVFPEQLINKCVKLREGSSYASNWPNSDMKFQN